MRTADPKTIRIEMKIKTFFYLIDDMIIT